MYFQRFVILIYYFNGIYKISCDKFIMSLPKKIRLCFIIFLRNFEESSQNDILIKLKIIMIK